MLYVYVPRSIAIIPCAFCYGIAYLVVGRNHKVVCLVPLIFLIPVVSSSSGIHTAEDQIGVSVRKLCSVNTCIANLSHINPSIAITEEVNCESSVCLIPVIVRNKINNDGLGRLIISDSVFKSLIAL